MGVDKAALEYHGAPQLRIGYDLLVKVFGEAYVSCRPDQITLPLFSGFPQIPDRWPEEGPLGAILSALSAFPDRPVFVLACDLPFAGESLIHNLLSQVGNLEGIRAPQAPKPLAWGYRSSFDGRAEPLCALWGAEAKEILEPAFAEGLRCARKGMELLSPVLFPLPDVKGLDNINRPEERDEALQFLSQGKKSE
jgi:molybdopterin-guanine dinucleotide biosynthesis protein A